MIFGIITTRDISKLSQTSLAEIMYNNFEISLVVFMSNITINHAITCTNHAVTYTNCDQKTKDCVRSVSFQHKLQHRCFQL